MGLNLTNYMKIKLFDKIFTNNEEFTEIIALKAKLVKYGEMLGYNSI